MKNNTIHRALVAGAVSLLFCASPGMAADAAGGAGWYLGAGLGQSTVKENHPGNGYTIDRDTHDTGYKLFGGYRFNRYFGIEGGYTDFGKEKFDWVYSAVESGAGKVSANAFSVSATGRLPVGYDFALLGKLGIARTQIKYREDWSQPGYEEHIRINRTTTVPLIGIGAEYALGKNLSLRAEYEAYGKVKMTRNEDKLKAKTDLISVSLGYQF